MKTLLLTAMLACATLVVPHPAVAQTIDPAFEQDIRKMLDEWGGSETCQCGVG